jgi:hypothetical protein
MQIYGKYFISRAYSFLSENCKSTRKNIKLLMVKTKSFLQPLSWSGESRVALEGRMLP